MRLNRIIAIPAIASLALVAGCNDKPSSSAASPTSDSASASVSAPASASPSASSSTCPTDGNTRAFAKTRFVMDLGVAAGTFHRYIYKQRPRLPGLQATRNREFP